MIVDLHTHTVFSDGVLIPAESARRALIAGYKGIVISDHADASNIDNVVSAAVRFKESYNGTTNDFAVLAGVELTHVRPLQIAELTDRARSLGADIVIVHGETIAEPVEAGTNKAAIDACVDIIAHPGFISDDDAELAAKNNVYLEITTRSGHAFTNGHIAAAAKNSSVKLVINNDFHEPGDYVGEDQALRILLGTGMSMVDARKCLTNTVALFEKKLGRKL